MAALGGWFEAQFPETSPGWRTIGREAEYPLVYPDGRPAPLAALWPHLESPELTPKREGDLLVALEGPDYIFASEVGWATVELITGPRDDLHQLAADHEAAMARLVSAADAEGILVLGCGIQPRAPATVDMMTPKQRYGALHEIIGDPWLTFALTASDQVHVDLGRSELIPMTNLGNLLCPLTIALCANSGVYGGVDGGHCSGREWSMGTIQGAAGRHGMPLRPYTSAVDMITALADQQFLIRKEDGVAHVDGRTFAAYVDAVGPTGDALREAFLVHEHYIWHSARPRAGHATLEFRSACQQPWSGHMAAAALGLGIAEAAPEMMDALRQYAGQADWASALWPAFRAWHSEVVVDGLAAQAPYPDLVDTMLAMATAGLARRGRGEEIFLDPLRSRANRGQNPAQNARALVAQGGVESIVAAYGITLGPSSVASTPAQPEE